MGLLRVLRPTQLSDTSLPRCSAPPSAPLVAPVSGEPELLPPVSSTTRRELWIVLGLTVFGGVLRFAFLDRPTLWIDEGFTYWRTSGTYRELVDILRDGGFTPLHYQAVWLVGRFSSLSPFFL